MDVSHEFKGKKITLMGLGLLGRGVGDAEFLAECGAELLVTDLKTEEQLAESLDRLSRFSNIAYVLGEHRLEDFQSCDMVLKAAGVPLDSPYIAEAKKHHIPVEMSGALFARLSGIPIIGITGSRGKSTTTQLIYHTLTRATEGGTVHLGGNVRGVSNLQLLKSVEEGDIAVMELDSWQLQGFGEAGISPHIAVFTNLLPDHMNYYKGNMEAYFDDKALIFANQDAGDVFITTPALFKEVEKYVVRKKYAFLQEVVLTDAVEVPADWVLPIPGEHNQVNIALAIEALRATSLSEEMIREEVESFEALPGRLQYVGEAHGVKIYNDNNSTSPAATRAGLEAVSEERNVVLIMGGSDKGLDMTSLLEIIPEYAKDIVLLAGAGTDTIRHAFPDAPLCASLKEAVDEAFSRAEAGDVILFSPAFASFGMFKNEYERNDLFMSLVQDHMNA